MARRFLPVILPGALLFAAAAALGGARGGWAPTRLVASGDRRSSFVVLLVAMHYARASAAGHGPRRIRRADPEARAARRTIGDAIC